MNITLPDALAIRLNQQAAEHGFDSIGPFIEALLDYDSVRIDHEHLEELLLDGIESGGAVEATPEFWQKQKREFVENHPDAAEYL
ncbi:MAG: hypothetical protein SGI88_10655 [Candidatus Hydrogenedentes bacterium]|nr:hypothetical protein [Candidatus Hydrogenedentota bacterium]